MGPACVLSFRVHRLNTNEVIDRKMRDKFLYLFFCRDQKKFSLFVFPKVVLPRLAQWIVVLEFFQSRPFF